MTVMLPILSGLILALSLTTANAQSPKDAETAIRAVVNLYATGTYEGDRVKLEQVFHPKAVMNGYLMGKLMLDASPKLFIEDVAQMQMKKSGMPYDLTIEYIDIDHKIASVVARETGFPEGASFSNYFHLIDDGSGWKIISKAFYGKR